MPEGELIGFNSFVENSTRATDPSYSNKDIAKFNVYGTVNNVLIYPGTEITKGEAAYGSAWTCPVDQYWIADADYKFVGIVDGNVANVTTTNLDGDGMPTSVEYTADGKTDLLCQTITRKNDTSIVKFNFSHLLSKVNFTVVNGSSTADGYSFVVKNITFNGATKATYDVVDAEWGTATATGNTVLGNTVEGSADKNIVVASKAASAELANEVLFLPGEYTISFTVDILYNGELVTTTNYPVSPAIYTCTLAANNAYNFKVNVAVGQLIQFTVEKRPTWTPNGDTTLTL